MKKNDSIGSKLNEAIRTKKTFGFVAFLILSFSLHMGLLLLFIVPSFVAADAGAREKEVTKEPLEAFALLGEAIEVSQEELGESVMKVDSSSQASLPLQVTEPEATKIETPKSTKLAASSEQVIALPSASEQKLKTDPAVAKEKNRRDTDDNKNTAAQRDQSDSHIEEQQGEMQSQNSPAAAASPQNVVGALGARAVKEGRAQLLRAFAKTLPQAAAGHAGINTWEIGKSLKATVVLKVNQQGRLQGGEVLNSSDSQLTALLKKNFLFLRRGRYRLSSDTQGVQTLAITATLKMQKPSSRYQVGDDDLSDALGIIESPNPNEFKTPKGSYLRFLSGRYFEFLLLERSASR